jgi:hypothetical protein
MQSSQGWPKRRANKLLEIMDMLQILQVNYCLKVYNNGINSIKQLKRGM